MLWVRYLLDEVNIQLQHIPDYTLRQVHGEVISERLENLIVDDAVLPELYFLEHLDAIRLLLVSYYTVLELRLDQEVWNLALFLAKQQERAPWR